MADADRSGRVEQGAEQQAGGLGQHIQDRAKPALDGQSFKLHHIEWPAEPDMPQHDWEFPRLDISPRECVRITEGSEPVFGWKKKAVERTLQRWRDIPSVGKPSDGMADKLFSATRNSCIKILGNAWIWGIPNLFFRWIVEQEKAEKGK
jgi:hypothetical protein